MRQYLFLVIASVCGTVAAQTPATNPMPDGSRDMYIGVGAQSVPRYDGASDRRTLALPVLQVQWSNGVFVSGTTLGWHLSQSPSMEFGPMLALSPRRDQDGVSFSFSGVSEGSGARMAHTSFRPGEFNERGELDANRLRDMDVVKRRVLAGGFFNYYLSPKLRLTNTLTYGSGREHNGARLHTALQYMMEDVVPHHTFVLSAGVSVVNRAYNETWFGVTQEEADRSGVKDFYRPGAGVQDVRAGVRWNWALSPSWMLTSGATVNRLVGDAKDSPLVERSTNYSISTALAYRF
ncbi:Outer membrane scaffolding protein for murein synthesis, MipA/OmpV family [Duganella sp. CF458]|uniref:MipA/OmpV family protein n=1 Tax=Duganella sp. CF458 TaxID=1884368 RepID=UPI0008F06CDE|nr:MipA/OmpV family protein [Duganella sp. CF458]SFF62175.1 Outer membrane scaffolding protein for murein synthesis, MipA/OmpV family [Duganella sp. CF458]